MRYRLKTPLPFEVHFRKQHFRIESIVVESGGFSYLGAWTSNISWWVMSEMLDKDQAAHPGTIFDMRPEATFPKDLLRELVRLGHAEACD